MELSFSNFVKKASSFLGLNSPETNRAPPLDGEIIYCKNNVCVHPPASLSTEVEHYPGYLTIRSQDDEILGTTLILTWIPNKHLKKNPRSIENSPAHPKISPRRSPRPEFARTDWSPSSSQCCSAATTPSSECAEKHALGHKVSTDVTSVSSSEGSSDQLGESSQLDMGEKSQSDSGIGVEEGGSTPGTEKTNPTTKKDSSSENASILVSGFVQQNNTLLKQQGNPSTNQKQLHIGQHVNDLHHKDTNVKKINMDGSQVEQGHIVEGNHSSSITASEDTTTSAIGDRNDTDQISGQSSDSDELTTHTQLNVLLHRPQPQQQPSSSVLSQKDRINERMSSGSTKSVASIEMDGDKLVIVTEEVDDSPFVENGGDGKVQTDGADDINDENDDASHGACAARNGEILKMVNECVTKDPSVEDGSSESSFPSPGGGKYREMLAELQEQTQDKLKGGMEKNILGKTKNFDIDKLKDSLDLKLDLTSHTSNGDVFHTVLTPDIQIDPSPLESCEDDIDDDGSSSTTSGPDSTPPSPITPLEYDSTTPGSPSSSVSSSATHNLMFPDNSVSYSNSPGFGTDVSNKSAKDQVCGVFSVDLGQMRFLRVFYSTDSCNSGHLVIASRESQYKILHFHCGGLDRLSETFKHWEFLAQARHKPSKKLPKHCKQFTVIRPYLPNKDKHPEEDAYEAVNQETWHRHMSATGQIEDDYHLRKATFFAGIEPEGRQEMWPFLLHYYPYISTFEEREQIRNDRYILYLNIRKERESMAETEQQTFWRQVQCIVEKDVVRTDRSHPYFRGVDNPNIEVLKNILLNYAMAHPTYGYTQGMSDLLAPVLAEVQNEADAYWCFVGLMQKTIFVSSPKDLDMDKQLNYLRELTRVMVPRFYTHLQEVTDGLELLFCHRWILLCFKREFPEADALRMWEACWAHFQTDYFHLFICVAIISVYGEDVIEQNLAADDMLLHFSSLSMHMNGTVILKKARAVLHRFRTRRKIPCTLEGLCILCGTGMWDSGHVPIIKCVGNHPEGVDDACPYGGVVDNSSED